MVRRVPFQGTTYMNNLHIMEMNRSLNCFILHNFPVQDVGYIYMYNCVQYGMRTRILGRLMNS
jgi:hypothetical protein